jgi:expansin (peptidoglycan-binding protein)
MTWVVAAMTLSCGSAKDGPAATHAGAGASVTGPTCPVAAAPVHTGEGTYYTFADGSGNCMFPATPNDLDIGAMNQTDYAASAACGMCAQVAGPDGTLTIRIVDRCPECKPGDIDFSPSAFAKLAALSRGRVPIQWTYVPCAVSGPIVYHFKDGSNQWWTAVQIRNHRFGISAFEYLDGNGQWQSVPRLDYNYFVAASGMGPGPYTVRVTDVNGATLEDSGVVLTPDGDCVGTNQFPDCP